MTYEMRDCEPTDYGRALEIINAAAEAYRGVIPADRWHEPYMSREEFDEGIAAGIRFRGCWHGDDLVGVMGIQPVKNVWLIRHAYVRPGLQRSGVGSTLMKDLLSSAPGQTLVGTWADATWAIAFYEKNGFTLLPRAQTPAVLREYWSIPERQIETSVVLARPALKP